jgi:hypothetical protein
VGAAVNLCEVSIELKIGATSDSCTFLAGGFDILASIEKLGVRASGFGSVWFGGNGKDTNGFIGVAAACVIEDINAEEMDWDKFTGGTGDGIDDIRIDPPVGAVAHVVDAAKGITDTGTELHPDETLGDAVDVAIGLEDTRNEPPATAEVTDGATIEDGCKEPPFIDLTGTADKTDGATIDMRGEVVAEAIGMRIEPELVCAVIGEVIDTAKGVGGAGATYEAATGATEPRGELVARSGPGWPTPAVVCRGEAEVVSDWGAGMGIIMLLPIAGTAVGDCMLLKMTLGANDGKGAGPENVGGAGPMV